MVASPRMSSSVRVCTCERFERSDEGKSDACERVTTTLTASSGAPRHRQACVACEGVELAAMGAPLHSAPHCSHVSMVLLLSVLASRRLPHWSQKTKEPMPTMSISPHTRRISEVKEGNGVRRLFLLKLPQC